MSSRTFICGLALNKYKLEVANYGLRVQKGAHTRFEDATKRCRTLRYHVHMCEHIQKVLADTGGEAQRNKSETPMNTNIPAYSDLGDTLVNQVAVAAVREQMLKLDWARGP